MNETSFARARRITGRLIAVCSFLWALWFCLPGIPVFRAPSASAATREAGRALFVHDWRPNDALAQADGLGPVFNATSCAGCHFQGGVGGAGTNEHNVLSFVALPTIRDREMRTGIVHTSAIDPSFRESVENLRNRFPIVPGGVRLVGGCSVRFEDFDPIHTESINTPALFGAGWIDRISDKSITHQWKRELFAGTCKEFNLDFTTLPSGRPRMLSGGRVGKFGWKGQFATLEEFVAAACANELGLGNPLLEQAKPLGTADYPSVKPDMTRAQFRELLAFVKTLPIPAQVLPADPAGQLDARRGRELFTSIGCAHCHTPDIGGLKGVYSDFLLHKVFDKATGYIVEQTPEVPMPADEPSLDEWKTPPLWGVASSAPYFHDGGSPTLLDAIGRHRGSATRVTEQFIKLGQADQIALITFLETLKAPAQAPGADSPIVAIR